MNFLTAILWTICYFYSVIPIYGITELDPVQIFDYRTMRNRGLIKDTLTKDAAFFHYIPGHKSTDEIYLGARDRLFTVPVPDVSQAREVVEWKSTKCNVDPNGYTCPPGDSRVSRRFACGNHIRLVLANFEPDILGSSGTDSGDMLPTLLTVCGSNGGIPKCQIYRRDTPKWIITKADVAGNGVVSGSLCPGEKNPFYFDKSTKKLFVSTNTLNMPSLVSFNAFDSILVNLHLRGSPFFYGKADSVTFHTMFRYDDKVYVLFNEVAYEADFNGQSIVSQNLKNNMKSRKRHFARVARVCLGDEGSTSRRRDKDYFSTFFKARLLCRSPDGFQFDYLVAVSEVDESESDPVVRAVFASDDGLTRAHGVCAFRTSAMERGIREGEFVVFKRDREASYLARRSSPLPKDTFMGCRVGKASSAVAGFAHKHPLMTNPVINDVNYPWRAFTTNSYNITTVAVDSSSGHEVMFLGTDGGLLLKLASMPLDDKTAAGRREFSVVESLQLFPHGDAINSLLLRRKHVIAVTNHEVRSISLHRCGHRRSCQDCIALRDPHCSWNAVTQRCSATANKLPTVRAGLDYCRNVETKPLPHVSIPSAEAVRRNTSRGRAAGPAPGLSGSAVGVIALICAVVGFAVGCPVGWCVFRRFGERLPTHLLDEIRRRTHQRSLGNEKASPGPKGVSSILKEASAKADPNLSRSNEYDSFLDHRSPPASEPLDKKLNNEVIKNNLMASLNHHKSIDNFL